MPRFTAIFITVAKTDKPIEVLFVVWAHGAQGIM